MKTGGKQLILFSRYFCTPGDTDMRLVNCYSRSMLGPSSLPSQFTELFGLGVKEADAVSLRKVLRNGLSLHISRASPGFGDL